MTELKKEYAAATSAWEDAISVHTRAVTALEEAQQTLKNAEFKKDSARIRRNHLAHRIAGVE